MRNFVIALAMVSLLAGNSFAGGAKKESSISVKNSSGMIAAVIVDPPANFPANPTQKQFLDAGGKLLQPNATNVFYVKAGSHIVYAQLVDENTGNRIGSIASVTKNAVKGGKISLTVTKSTSNSAHIQ